MVGDWEGGRWGGGGWYSSTNLPFVTEALGRRRRCCRGGEFDRGRGVGRRRDHNGLLAGTGPLVERGNDLVGLE